MSFHIQRNKLCSGENYMNRLRLQNSAGEYRCRLSERAWLGKVTLVWGSRDQNIGCLYSVGSVDVTGSYAEDTTMTSHQNFLPLYLLEKVPAEALWLECYPNL